jgi:hypothetical protein
MIYDPLLGAGFKEGEGLGLGDGLGVGVGAAEITTAVLISFGDSAAGRGLNAWDFWFMKKDQAKMPAKRIMAATRISLI